MQFPDDHTRVVLKADPDVEGSDYINASFIDVSNYFYYYYLFQFYNHFRATQTRNMPTLQLRVRDKVSYNQAYIITCIYEHI